MDDKAETQVGTSKDVIQANPPTIVEILPSAAKPATVDKKKLFLAGRGGLGEEIGRGREKTARRVGTDKVLITYHGAENQRLATPDYTKAQYYMHSILHDMLPDNFPAVYAGGDDAILVERIPDTEDLVKAREINKLYIDPKKHHLIETEQRDWWQQKTREIKSHPEYEQAVAILQAMGLGYGKDEDPYELAQPINTVMIDEHPVLLEMMKPIVTNDKYDTIPRMNIDQLTEVVREGVGGGFLDEKTQNRILMHAVRYQENAQQAAKQAQDQGIIVY